MSQNVLIRDYNPAYDYWLRAHLKEKRIMGDREYSWKEAQDIIMDMDSRGTHDDFFQKYFWAWANHPEYSPDYFALLRSVLPIEKNGRLDLAAVADLDGEARKRNQRILFSVEDAAKDFDLFYKRFLLKPLARDLERGTNGETLSGYFEREELDLIPDIRVCGRQTVEKAVNDIASALVERIRGITSEKILSDIKLTLNRHYHVGLAAANMQGSYLHKSDYVQLSMHRAQGPNTPVTTFLTPARCRRVLKEGYEGVYYPTYQVELSSGSTTLRTQSL